MGGIYFARGKSVKKNFLIFGIIFEAALTSISRIAPEAVLRFADQGVDQIRVRAILLKGREAVG